MNPGWTTRHVAFYRLSPAGAIADTPVLPDMPFALSPKRLRMLTHDFRVQ